MKTETSKFDKYFTVFIWTVIVVICIPFLRAACFAGFTADDFSFAVPFGSEKADLFQRALYSTISYWKTWQGAYASTFLLYLINPLNWYSYRLLKIILIGLFVLAVSGLYLCLKELKNYYSLNIKPVYLFYLILIPILSYREYYEIYLWFVGATAYLLPVVGMEFSIIFILKWKRKRKAICYILAVISMIFMNGCVLEVTGMGMWCLLIFVIYDFIKNGKADRGLVIAFVTALALAVLNAFAPGNFARKGTGELKALSAVLYSFKAVAQETVWLHSNATILIFELIALIFGANDIIGHKKSLIAIELIGLILFPVITVFPVILGYGAESNDLYNRCLFPLDCALTVSCIGLFYILGNCIGEKCASTNNSSPKAWKILCPVLVIMILIPSLIKGPARSVWATVADHLYDGKIPTNSYICREIYDSIKDSKEETVIITEPVPERKIGSTDTVLSEDPNEWINMAVANYFNKEKVIYIPDFNKEQQ